MNAQVFDPTGEQMVVPNRPKDWFCYPLLYTAVAPDDIDNLTLQIDAGSDFYLTALTYFAHVNGSTATPTAADYVIPEVSLQITDTGSNRQLFNEPVALNLIAGDGNHPHRLIHPRLFRRNSAIKTTLVNFGDTDTYDYIRVNLEGFKIYG